MGVVSKPQARFVELVNHVLQFQEYRRKFFHRYMYLWICCNLITSCTDAQISRTGDFCADNNNNDTADRHTNRLLYPCCACEQGKNIICVHIWKMYVAVQSKHNFLDCSVLYILSYMATYTYIPVHKYSWLHSHVWYLHEKKEFQWSSNGFTTPHSTSTPHLRILHNSNSTSGAN